MTIVLSTALPTTALSTYDKLKTAVAAWLHRSDLTSVIPDLVALAEARIARDLRIRRMISNATLSTVANVQEVVLPDDYLEIENISVATSPERDLVYMNIQAMNIKYPVGGYSGVPVAYTLEGNNLLLGPTPDTAYSLNLLYYSRLTPLEQDPSNWLLANHPGIYLFGTLAESGDFVRDQESLSKWEAKYKQSIEELQAADDRSMFSGSQLRVRNV